MNDETPRTLTRIARALRCWFDSSAGQEDTDSDPQRVDWARCVPFFLMHLACLGVLWTGWSLTAVVLAIVLYATRMFAITAFYHRYFSHRTFKTSRAAQLVFAILGNSAAQRGPLWWASQHRHHHQHSDTESDSHSPVHHSFLWSHMLWLTSRASFPTREERVKDLARYPELRFLDRFDTLVPLVIGLMVYGLGEALAAWAPALGTSGLQLLVWSTISTVVLFHASCTINSVAHRIGSRRFATRDESRNNFALALLTLGEGWHNNHHYFPGAARQGFYWWEIDLSYYGLKALEKLGVIWELNPVPAHVLESGRRRARDDRDEPTAAGESVETAAADTPVRARVQGIEA